MTDLSVQNQDLELAEKLFSAWHVRRDEQGLQGGLQIFDRLRSLEARSEGVALDELREIIEWLRANGLERSARRGEIEVFMRKLQPVEQPKGERLLVPAHLVLEAPVSGPWNAVTGEEKAGFLQQISPIDGRHTCDPACTQVAWAPLSWYENVALIRVIDPQWENKRLIVYYLTREGNLYRLKGGSAPIHEVNAKAPIRVTPETVLDYARFFCFFVRGEEGPFYVLEFMDDPMLPPDMDATTLEVLNNVARPARLVSVNESGQYLCDLVMFYSNALFVARLAIEQDGRLDMLEDELIRADLPARINEPLS